MQILVIGGARFIGLHVIKKLCVHNHSITVCTTGNHPIPCKDRVKYVRGDRNKDFVGIKDDFDVVIDMCAYTGNHVRKALEEISLKKYVLISTVAAYAKSEDMPSAIDGHDIAISAAGSTCYELASMGVPALTIITAENHNQDGLAEGLEAAGATINLGFHQDLSEKRIAQSLEEILNDEDRRRSMSNRGRALIDGEGAQRVLMHMTGNRLRLRTAREEDCKMIWEWANDPVVRQNAFSTEHIPWDTHVRWFSEKLRNPHTFIFLAFDAENQPLGQIRFDCEKEEEATIDVHLAPNQRGKGYGSELISVGIHAMTSVSGVHIFHAFIRETNATSLAAFRKSGFREVERTQMKGIDIVHLSLE